MRRIWPRHLVERLVPADALELPAAARARPAAADGAPVGVVEPLGLAEAAHAGVEGRQLGRPLARIGADRDDAPVAHVGVDDAAPAAVVAAGAGDDGLAGCGGGSRGFVDDGAAHGSGGDSTTSRRVPGRPPGARLRRHGAADRHRGRRADGAERGVPSPPRGSGRGGHRARARAAWARRPRGPARPACG